MKAFWALIRSAVMYGAASGFAAAVPLLLVPLLTRLLTPEDYGRVGMFTVMVQLLATLAGLSVHGAVGMRYFDRETLDFPRYVASCLMIVLVSTLIVIAGVIVFEPLLERYTQLPAKWLILAAVVAGANFITQTQLSIWQSSKQAHKFAVLRAVQAGVDLGASIALVVVVKLAWEGRVGGIAAGMVCAAAISLVTLVRGQWFRLPIDREYIRGALKFGIPLVPHAIGGMLIAVVDRLLITNLLDVGSTGIYVLAIQIGLILNLATDSLNRAASPWLIEHLKDNDRAQDVMIVRLTYLYFALMLVAGVALGLIAPMLLAIFVGEKFQPAASIIIYIAIGQAFAGMYYILSNYVFYAGQTGKLAIVSLSSGIVSAGISYYLLKVLGLRGAAIAFIVAQGMLFLGTWALAHHVRPMPWLAALKRRPSGVASPGLAQPPNGH